MRLLIVLVILLFAAAGVVFGALNADLVGYDLLFGHVAVPKGAAVLGSLLAGWILGGVLVWLLVVQPLRHRLRKAARQSAQAATAITSDQDADAA